MENQKQKIEILKKLFHRKDYHQATNYAHHLLELDPGNREIKKILKKSRQIFANREVKGAIVFVCLALLSVVLGFTFMTKKIVQELRIKDWQVNSLIDEIGQLRFENLDLDQELVKNQGEIVSLEGKLELLKKDGVDIEKIWDSLEEAHQKIKVQDQTVESLVESGLKLAEKVESKIGADETFDLLILGTHESLTDTILTASINPGLKTISLFSIPRDLYVNGRKINEFYFKFGGEKLRQIIYGITGLQIEKYLVVDSKAFLEIIDILGGIDIYVEEGIYDALYPGPGGTYTTFSIVKGPHHLDGETALKYARSRKSTSDFDRAKRQQQIIKAVSDKLKSLDLLSDLNQALQIYNSVKNNVKTNIDVFEGIQYFKDYSGFEIEQGNVLSTDNYLYSTYNLAGQYILLPRAGDYSKIQNYVADLIKN